MASIESIFSKFKNENYQITYDQQLGKGATSAIFPVTLVKKQTGKYKQLKFVIKIFYKSEDKQREVDMLAFINDTISAAASENSAKNALFEHFISLEESGDVPNPFAILERCQKNLKQHFIDEVNPQDVIAELKKILNGYVFPAILFLHENNVVHGDIKAENIMFGSKHWKLIDFGCASFVGAESAGGSYMPPEHIRALEKNFQPRSTVKVDAFALGITIVDILSQDATPYWELVESSKGYSNFTDPLPRRMAGLLFLKRLPRFSSRIPTNARLCESSAAMPFLKMWSSQKTFTMLNSKSFSKANTRLLILRLK